MEFTSLGRTGLWASRLGLGCGGHSRLGLAVGKTEPEAQRVVEEALDLGINFIDTAEAYATEEVVGKALAGRRTEVILSTKAGVNYQDRRCTPAEMEERVQACMKRLKTDYIDLFNLHGVAAKDYDYAVSDLLPTLVQLKQDGKIRHIGITETFGPDPQHVMLQRAVLDPYWDVMMVGFNILNQSARDRVLKQTREQRVGTLCMFAVRRALSQPEALVELIANLSEAGAVEPASFDRHDPLGFVVKEYGAESLVDAAYRYCRYEPGMNVILSGTSNIEHLRQNAASLERPPLPEACIERLKTLFAGIDSVSGN